jgi:hypothetical protein
MSVSDKIIDKLKKILARADTNRGATAAEVEAAMKKAQELAIEHNIDLSTINVDGEIKVGGIETEAGTVHTATKQERPYHMPVLSVLRNCFDIKDIVDTYTDRNSMRIITKVTFVGEKLDVALATYCWSWLEQLFPQTWLTYRKEKGMKDDWTAMRSFYAGLRDGLIENNRRQRAEVKGKEADRYALVIANKQELVEAKFNELFPKTRPVKSFTMGSNPSAREAGRIAGSKIKLNGGLTGGAVNPKLA